MNNITHEIHVGRKTAELLKKAGFDWGTNQYYGSTPCLKGTNKEVVPDAYPLEEKEWVDNNALTIGWCKNRNYDLACAAHTLDVAQRWLREVHGIHVYVSGFNNYRAYREGPIGTAYLTEVFDTYEQALEEGLQKCLTIILEGNE